MKANARIASIANVNSLDSSITGCPSFELSALYIPSNLEFELPTNVRLGHLVEKIVSEFIKSSTNYRLLFENTQLVEAKKTIGEIDFILQEIATKQVIHLELAYKFYLFDPEISSNPINNWIGPNRNDSLKEKLEKLKTKQFPLLFQSTAASTFKTLDLDEVAQKLCFLASLFVPFEYKSRFNPNFEKAIKGHYLNFKDFKNLDHSAKTYHLPIKKEWGIEPAENEIWTDFSGIEKALCTSMLEKQSVLCWQNHKDSFDAFFIVWW